MLAVKHFLSQNFLRTHTSLLLVYYPTLPW